MGSAREMICKTCKTTFYLGYGGASYHKELENNFWKLTKDAHELHDKFLWSSDYERIVDGNLYGDNPMESDNDCREREPDVRGYSEYHLVNLSGENYPSWRSPFIPTEEIQVFKCLSCLVEFPQDCGMFEYPAEPTACPNCKLRQH